ncbi:hypothetical protein Tco_1106228 [Tanacetum coccineum]
MEYGMAAHLMTILEKFSLHEEFHKVDHHENGASWSTKVDTCEPVGSTGLRAATERTRETTLSGGFKNLSNISWNKISQSFFVGGTYGVEEGGFGTSLELIEITKPSRISTWFKQLPLNFGLIFRQRRSVVESEQQMFKVSAAGEFQ